MTGKTIRVIKKWVRNEELRLKDRMQNSAVFPDEMASLNSSLMTIKKIKEYLKDARQSKECKIKCSACWNDGYYASRKEIIKEIFTKIKQTMKNTLDSKRGAFLTLDELAEIEREYFGGES